MPRKFMFTKEEIISAALELTRRGGMAALTARALGAELGTSSRPVFSLFKNMEEVQTEVIKAANNLYQSYLQEDMASGKYPPYKASGMAYIRFSREALLENNKRQLGLNEEDAYCFHLEMWIYVHGIATMLATSYLEWDEEFISRVVTDGYEGMKARYLQRKQELSGSQETESGSGNQETE